MRGTILCWCPGCKTDRQLQVQHGTARCPECGEGYVLAEIAQLMYIRGYLDAVDELRVEGHACRDLLETV